MPDVPLLLTDEVVHLGTLNLVRRGEYHTSSQEGHCLSVSHAPHAWQRIARLGGEPMQVLHRTGGAFVDALDMQNDPLWVAMLATWAVSDGLAVREERWKVWAWDSEADDWTFTTHESIDDARDERLDLGEEGAGDGEGPEGRPALERFEALIATAALVQRLGLPEGTPVYDVEDALLLAWADEHLPEVDGVWWCNTYAPDGLSAPRAGIFPSRLARWSVSPGHLPAYEDDETGQRLNISLCPAPSGWATTFVPSSADRLPGRRFSPGR